MLVKFAGVVYKERFPATRKRFIPHKYYTVSEKPTSAEAVGVGGFHGTGNGVQWQARSANLYNM